LTIGRYIDDNWCFVNRVKLMHALQSNFNTFNVSDELTDDIKRCIDVVIDYEYKLSC